MSKKIIYALTFVSIMLSILSGLNYWLALVRLKPIFSLVIFIFCLVALIALSCYWIVIIRARAMNASKSNQIKKILTHAIEKVTARLYKRTFFIWRKQEQLYQLPWFLVLGLEKTGKTPLLNALNPVYLNAELHLNEQAAQYGCDWYLTRRAICLNVSEALLTQTTTENEIDLPAVWQFFLKLIKRYRHKKPINGIVLLINMATFQTAKPEEIKQYGQVLYQRLHEIYRIFNRILPIHMILTGCDSLHGYEEFYSDSTLEEHKNTLGFLIPTNKQKNLQDEFFSCYDKLIANIYTQLFLRLHHNNQVENAHAIFNYPLQVIWLKEKLQVLFTQLYRISSDHSALCIKSFYLSMSEPNSNVIDVFSSELVQQFTFPENHIQLRKQKENKLFVLHDYFRLNILSASHQEWFTERYQQKIHALRISGYLLMGLLFGGAAYSLCMAYARNQTQLNIFIQMVDDYKAQLKYRNGFTLDTSDILRKSEALELIKNVYNPIQHAYHLHLHWGFYPGEKIKHLTRQLYDNELTHNFLPALVKQVQATLQQTTQTSLATFESLAVYLMLGSPEHMDHNFVKNWFAADWRKTYSNPFIAARLDQQLENLLKLKLPDSILDMGLIEKIRTRLKPFNGAEYFYTDISQQAEKSGSGPLYLSPSSDFDFGQIFGASAAKLSVPLLYSENGYPWFTQAADHLNKYLSFTDWVLNDSTRADFSAVALNQQIDKIYFRNYSNTWQQAIQNLKIAPFENLQDAADKLNIIAAPATSPLLTVLNVIAKNTNASNLLKNKNSSVLTTDFAPLNNLLQNQAPSNKPPIAAVLDQLQKLDLLVKSISNSENPDKAAFQFAATFTHSGQNTVFSDLLQQAKQVPLPLKTWLTQIVAYSWQTILNGAANYINSQWQNQIWPYYSKFIKDKYPFVNTTNQVSVAAFNHFFCSTGLLDNFGKTYLAPFVSGDFSQLKLSAQLNQSLPVTNAFLNQYQYGMQIRHAFCKNTPQAKIQFTLSASNLSDTSAYAQLDINGHSFIYRHGPAIKNISNWPGNPTIEQTILNLYGLNSQNAALTTSGLWSVFKLFQQAKNAVFNKETETWHFNFNFGAQSVTYAVKTNHRLNPLAPGFFENFKLTSNVASDRLLNHRTQS